MQFLVFDFGVYLPCTSLPGPSGMIETPDPSDPQSAEHGAHAMLVHPPSVPLSYCPMLRGTLALRTK
eukprot:2185799-Rhodomonas_salina.3